ncbi:hypothetical protein HII36_22675 [Nonomuraea sp. NN258]|uniref:hypothetical protein n=1 Tax=Nonomuraea antri TaxID=2730852 RepID=UPI0015686A86|nr:hypothetical protein [Nonomuraea antri]NRQ34619.1 hypothetical protein [Nonomuraea antri]
MIRFLVIAAALALVTAGCSGARERTAPEVAGYVGTYLRAHPDVKRVAKNDGRVVTLITRGRDHDLSSDTPAARLVHVNGVSYLRIEPDERWDQVTDEHGPYNAFGKALVCGLGECLVNAHRVHEALATGGRVTGPVSEGGLDRYSVAIDVRAAVAALDLGAFLEVYDPVPPLQDMQDEYDLVRAGDRAAGERVRAGLLAEFGPAATYHLWLDGRGRPVRARLESRTPVEISYSDWDATTVTAPPAEQVQVLN